MAALTCLERWGSVAEESCTDGEKKTEGMYVPNVLLLVGVERDVWSDVDVVEETLHYWYSQRMRQASIVDADAQLAAVAQALLENHYSATGQN